jgi:antitoxin ParD1/3/4
MANRMTLNISLTPELGAFVSGKVASGRYLSASEVVRDGLRLLEERDELRAAAVTEVRGKIAAGLASLDRGEGMDGEQAFEELERRLMGTPAAAARR